MLRSDPANSTEAAYRVPSWPRGAPATRAAAQPGKFLKTSFREKSKDTGSFISFHFISFHFISFHFISFHFISFHFISFHFISFHFISFHFISFHFISFHFISFHFISFHFIHMPPWGVSQGGYLRGSLLHLCSVSACAQFVRSTLSVSCGAMHVDDDLFRAWGTLRVGCPSARRGHTTPPGPVQRCTERD